MESAPTSGVQASPSTHSKPIFPYERWHSKLSSLREEFRSNVPYSHVVLDDFLDIDVAREIDRSFPSVESSAWIHYKHYNESTLGKNDLRTVPEPIRRLLDELLSSRFTSFLADLTGISDLMSDPTLEGGGIHVTEKGGFLRVHTDFTHHNRRPDHRRRCNLILYLNDDWKEEWGGALEMWDSSVKRCERSYLPLFNRAIIFETTTTSYHGYPLPISPPDGVSRRSITSYYYTLESEGALAPRSTHYVVRPGENSNRFLVHVDNMLLSVYSRLKRTTGISDEFTGRILSLFRRRKRKE